MFDENCYIVRRPDSTDAVVIDPGLDPESIQRVIAEQHLQVKAILNTHGHSDHIAGNEFLKRCWPNAELAKRSSRASRSPSRGIAIPFVVVILRMSHPEGDERALLVAVDLDELMGAGHRQHRFHSFLHVRQL